MRPPISFTYGNCVFGDGAGDAWAGFAVQLASYAWLSADEKRARFLSLVAGLESLEADTQLLRVSGTWDVDRYEARLRATRGDGSRDLERARHEYATAHGERLRGLAPDRTALFLFVSLREPGRDVATFLSSALAKGPRAWLQSVKRALADQRLLGTEELEHVRVKADRAHARLAASLPVRAVRSVEIQWLVRRAFCRGLGEPAVDELHEPRALTFERNGDACLAPLEGDVLRWMNSEVEDRGRVLRIESELGLCWQASLVLGAVPERMQFPSQRAELMFAAPESLDFGVDLCVTARYLPNELALRVARRRVQDADQIARAENSGEQGLSDLGYARTQDARDLLSYLQAPSRPPLLRATVAIGVAAGEQEELERRVELVRRAYGEVQLHRPLGAQLPIFIQQLPAQRTQVAGFEDTFTAEQLAAMMPTATHLAGASQGFYLGHTLSGSRRPVLFSLREGSDSDANATVLSVGALGSGKTTLAQKLQYEGFLGGARVIDCDPKGDHRFHLLEEVAPHVESIALEPDPKLRGMLDPLRIAPAHLRQDAAVSFLRDLLPVRADPAWETAIVGAVDSVMRRASDPTCLEVVRALQEGQDAEIRAGAALEVFSRSGLTQLGFADRRVTLPAVGERQVTYLPIRDLPGPPMGAARADYSQTERVGEQLVRLIAMFAMQLMAGERDRLKLFCFDEGWRLLGDPVGRLLLASLQRMGRSELAVPIISTQLVTDTLMGEHDSLASLVGATFVFGVRSEHEASRALQLLGLDPEDQGLRRFLLELERGRCLFRDHRGRIEALQVDVVVPELLRAFSTTPGARR